MKRAMDIDGIKVQRDSWSMKNYKKHEVELTLDEMKQLDNEYPGWTQVYTKRGDAVEVTLGGTRVRNYKTKEEYRIAYPTVNGKPWYPMIIVVGTNGKYKYLQDVHRLVAEASVTNPDPWKKVEVNHIDGNKQNNAWWNLEWVTHKENIQHAVKTGLIPTGENNHSTKFTDKQVELVCDLLSKHPDWSYRKIAEVSGVSQEVVGVIYRKHGRKAISTKYDFPERDAVPKGEEHANAKYTTDQVRQVCEILSSDSKISFKDIEKLTGVDNDTVGAIYYREHWVDISKEYEFKKRDSIKICTPDIVEKICNVLDDLYLGKISCTSKEIADMFGVNKGVIDHLRCGERWSNITRNHVFYQAKFGDQAKLALNV